jgi:hypothetical protein
MITQKKGVQSPWGLTSDIWTGGHDGVVTCLTETVTCIFCIHPRTIRGAMRLPCRGFINEFSFRHELRPTCFNGLFQYEGKNVLMSRPQTSVMKRRAGRCSFGCHMHHTSSLTLSHEDATCFTISRIFRKQRHISTVFVSFTSKIDRLCGLVVIVPGYRFRGPGSIPGATRFSEK